MKVCWHFKQEIYENHEFLSKNNMLIENHIRSEFQSNLNAIYFI